MKNGGRLAAYCGLLTAFSCANASAEEFGFSVDVNHAATPVGRPQLLTIPVNTPFLPPGQAATFWSFDNTTGDHFTVFDYSNLSLDPADHQTRFDALDATPVAALSAYQFSNTGTFATFEALANYVNDLSSTDTNAWSDLNYGDTCHDLFNPDLQQSIATLGQCDAVDASLSVGVAGFRVTGAQDTTNMTFTIDPVGYSFTSTNAFDRDEALSQFGTDFDNSPKADELAARLLGLPSISNIAPGTLPTGGTFLHGSFAFSHSAHAADADGPAQTAETVQKTFGFASVSEILGYALINRHATLEDFGLSDVSYTDHCGTPAPGGGRCDAVDLTLGFGNLALHVQAAENSPNVAFSVDKAGINFTSNGAVDRDTATTQFNDFLSTGGNQDKLVAAFLAAFAATRPDDPLTGNPNSVQGQFNTLALDLDSPSASLGETSGDSSSGGNSSNRGGANDDPSGWMVGGRAGSFTVGEQDAHFVQLVAEKGWRFGEGSRDRLKLSVPFQYTDYGDDQRQSSGAVRLSLEHPLQQDKWVIEPSLGLGYFAADGDPGSGSLASAGISSRYKIAPVGRGHIVIGNAINYSTTLEIEGSGAFKTPKIENVSFRNGLAYQVPIGERFFGSQGSLRVSYTYTSIKGDDVFLDAYHEASVSLGIGSREVSVRQYAEALRLGVSGAWGDNYNSFSVNLGYRF